MKNVEKIKYVLPSPQEALGGDFGLTAAEIAISLGVEPSHIRQKLKRLELKNDVIFKTSQTRRRNESNGRDFDEWVLNVAAAKYIVATWKNKMGIDYFKYLLACERAAEEQIPFLEKSIDLLTKKLNKKNRISITIHKIVKKWGIFGWEPVLEQEKIPRQEADVLQLREYRFRQRAATLAGMVKKQEEDLKSGVIVPMVDESKLLPETIEDL